MSCKPLTLCCGPFVAGEHPDPLVYSFQHADGSPINLAGYSASWCFAERWGSAGTGPASVTGAAAGEVTHPWGAELIRPGRYTGQLWVTKAGSPTYASLPIRFDVAAGVCAA